MDNTPAKSRAQTDAQAWWTPQRKVALRLTLEGDGQSQIAKKIGVHRHTVAAWQIHPAWLDRVRRELLEKQTRSALRRAHTAEAIACRLEELVTRGLQKRDLRVGELQVLLRELREYSKMERDNFEQRSTSSLPPRRRYLSEKNHPAPAWAAPMPTPEESSLAREGFRRFLRGEAGPSAAKIGPDPS